MDEGIHKK